MPDPSNKLLRELSLLRLREARVLLKEGHPSGSYYLAGYSIECGIKAVIANSFRKGVIPSRSFVHDIYTHDLRKLLSLAGLTVALKTAEHASPQFRTNLAIVLGWNEASRYEKIEFERAKAMIQAVGDRREGVIKWLKNHW
jgi:HEPN domain-containing protein